MHISLNAMLCLCPTGVVSVSVHPGNLLATSLHRHCLARRLASQLLRPWTKSPDMAAASVVLGLTSEEVNKLTLKGLYKINNFLRHL